jgi:hypothetical protein
MAMTLTACWAAKGGSGTTVVAAALALGSAGDSVLVDLAGELPATLGVPEPNGAGLADWFNSDADPQAVLDLAIDVTTNTRLVPCGPAPIPHESSRWQALRTYLATSHLDAIVDAGTSPPPPALIEDPCRGLLVTRACYLALARACRYPRPDGIVLIDEPGRSLTAADVSHAIGAPIVARIELDPAIARAVDAGLLAARLPHRLRTSLHALTQPAPHLQRTATIGLDL